MKYSAKELIEKLYSSNISASLKNPINNLCKRVKQSVNFVRERNPDIYNAVRGRPFRDSAEGTPYNPNLRARVKKHLRKIVAGGITTIYEGVLLKYLYDLNNVLSHPSVQARVWRGKLPIYPVEAELFPWPKLIEYPVTDVTGGFARPMSQIDYAVKFFHDNPILQGVAIATPFILWGIYYGIKKYGGRNER